MDSEKEIEDSPTAGLRLLVYQCEVQLSLLRAGRGTPASEELFTEGQMSGLKMAIKIAENLIDTRRRLAFREKQ